MHVLLKPIFPWVIFRANYIQKAVIKWRGKPVFIRHRTQDEIKEAQEIDWKTLRDPQPDEERVQKPEWLIMLGWVSY